MRASLILGVAAIEAISNDTLASIYELLMDAWPSECVGLPPWMYFTPRAQTAVGREIGMLRKPARNRRRVDGVTIARGEAAAGVLSELPRL